MSHTATCAQDGHVDVADHLEASAEPAHSSGHPPAARARALSFLTLPEVRWSALSLLGFLAGLLSRPIGAPGAVTAAILAACYAAGGWEPALVGVRALRRGVLDVDILMIVAALVAAAVGQAIDGALLIVIFSTSGALEAVATKRTRDSVRSLLSLAPERAARLGADGSEQLVDTAALAIGDRVVVRPGERIGADGCVVEGASDVDEASITGEPLPVPKAPGDEVFAGTLNGSGALTVRVDRAAADTVVARIVALVEEASATKAQMQLFIDKVEQRYSIGLVIATVALFALPLLLGGSLRPTLLRAMTFMIVASPCAVVLATMPPLLSAIANAGRHGVLVKSAVVMERLGETGIVAFDKTGTLTQGTPLVIEVLAMPDAALDADRLLCLAAAAERPSEHALGRAVVIAARERGLRVPDATGFLSVPGQGVRATVEGRQVAVGSPRLAHGARSADAGQAGLIDRLHDAGRTAVVVTVDGAPGGVLGLTDRVRPGAADTVRALRRVTGRVPVLLTGDNAGAAGRLAEEVGITDVRAQLLPQDKVTAVRRLQEDGTRVTLVGDGVNDAPALAAAHLGVAMGRSGSDLALETADAVIVGDDLATLPAMILLSRRARRVITQNLLFAGIVVCTLVGLDLSGHLPLPLGVAGHEGSTVVVGLNGLRLLSRRAWRPSGAGGAPGRREQAAAGRREQAAQR